MEELIQKLQNIHGLTPEQSRGILTTITGYIKEKFPMVAGAVDNLFQSGTTPSAPGTTPSDVQSTTNSENIMDQIRDFVPGAEEKLSEFAKEKLGGFFGGNKSE
jgi:hypothetical protein